MINISDELNTYIDIYFTQERKADIYRLFFMLEEFHINNYEDPYINMITSIEELGQQKLQDLFNAKLIKDAVFIIEEHGIKISRQHDIELHDVLGIVEFLYAIQRREDYDEINRRLYTDDENDEIIFGLIELCRASSDFVIRNIIAEVEDDLIEQLRELFKEHMEELGNNIDLEHKAFVDSFKRYLGDTPCVGIYMYALGYNNVTLYELFQLSKVDIREHLDSVLVSKPEQAALDILSLLFITKDSYKDPIKKLERNMDILFNEAGQVTQPKLIIERMLADFNSYLEGVKNLGATNEGDRVS